MVKAQSQSVRLSVQIRCLLSWLKFQIGIVSRVGFFFGAAIFGLTEQGIFAEILLGEFAVAKANLLVEMTFSLVGLIPRSFSDFVESPHCKIGLHKKAF
ncbi:hypothetical protein P5E07_22890 [Vibrio parahaemolyticus]|uniref:hypothetical protein n=1 Tax=Vibrio parahaemolyticus TaxID=670 RepID=UPI0022B5070E|nr:hypothetical protein [Vibrio parahaemolyticus]MCZ6279453.1 hypothetical protein [Vibrio parahaemolyticus]MDF5242327.1 hypothetical protein [Vibrio parahaemolyticus]MDF5495808.1 hypothetical protein [Vibrio parahaemolyticus]MDG2721295.1 hypothetical protein [Vibrio parahaemolyticus]MDG3389425.1 hypothetical protein [Vibrio parahaemolyticus]